MKVYHPAAPTVRISYGGFSVQDQIPIDPQKKETVKAIIRGLHAGEDPKAIKAEFGELLASLSSVQIAQIEEELMREGMPLEEMHELCDLHLEVFREAIDAQKDLAPPGHPVNILMEEHAMLIGFTGRLRELAGEVLGKGSFAEATEELKHVNHVIEQLKDSTSHYVREENVLFPYVEKHGLTGPPKVMWSEHDEVREMKKEIYALVEKRDGLNFSFFSSRLETLATKLAEFLSDHFTKENKVLFPASLRLLDQGEWAEARQQFDELGYCCFTPKPANIDFKVQRKEKAPSHGDDDRVDLEPGPLSRDELQSILDHLPVDISFVDTEDKVRYFNETPERIFPRTKAVIGRTVQGCHPEKSMHKVQQILDDFKAGKRTSAEFWLELGGKFIHIRYFAVHNREGKYLGCLEASQDLTPLRKLEGKKLLLDG